MAAPAPTTAAKRRRTPESSQKRNSLLGDLETAGASGCERTLRGAARSSYLCTQSESIYSVKTEVQSDESWRKSTTENFAGANRGHRLIASASSEAVSGSIRNGSFTRRRITNSYAKTRHKIHVISASFSQRCNRGASSYLGEESCWRPDLIADSGITFHVRFKLRSTSLTRHNSL